MKHLISMLLAMAVLISLSACNTPTSESVEDIYTNTIPEEIKNKSESLPAVSFETLPKWHGLEYEVMGDYPDGYRYYGFESGEFSEQDIKNIAELGFNFVRVPLNTKYYFKNEDINQPDMSCWENLDSLVRWGIEYHVHISLVVSETYGYNCTYSEEEGTLFTNEEQMKLFLTFWETVARRYADISTNALSFNILNEPCDWIGEERYCKLALTVAEKIWEYAPNRLIISDMNNGGLEPLYGLVGSGIVQSIHCYQPNSLHAGEIKSWPYEIPMVNSHIYGGDHFTLRGDFPSGTEVTVAMTGISSERKMMLLAENEECELFSARSPEIGVNHCTNIYTDDVGNVGYANYDVTVTKALTNQAKTLEIYPSGDANGTLDISQIDVRYPGGESISIEASYIEDNYSEIVPVADLSIDVGGKITDNNPSTEYQSDSAYDINWLRGYFERYAAFAEETGTTIFVNEFGVPTTADYDATLSYIDDFLTVLDEHNWCWSMYDYIGPFCLVKGENPDHIRKGAEYSTIGDCEVDVKLYETLQKHM